MTVKEAAAKYNNFKKLVLQMFAWKTSVMLA